MGVVLCKTILSAMAWYSFVSNVSQGGAAARASLMRRVMGSEFPAVQQRYCVSARERTLWISDAASNSPADNISSISACCFSASMDTVLCDSGWSLMLSGLSCKRFIVVAMLCRRISGAIWTENAAQWRQRHRWPFVCHSSLLSQSGQIMSPRISFKASV